MGHTIDPFPAPKKKQIVVVITKMLGEKRA